ncbi:metalloregulator ArsR/SmtB family transcription factor [uncultured Zhongshania sp.]|uniref:ArsR/SmtB family transcription factor n=1 Tax=uncultured Zhongshania sp. TaxID=1642288 RepID=UPI0030DCA125|tara:strand:+ start:1643 stop:2665 length:1023 start_codon:yes stop_codon:yes gene_type:complete
MNTAPQASSNSTSLDTELLQLCKAGGDALRLQVLRVLSRDAYSVQELCHILDCRQSGMSHHLKTLTVAGLITKRREGNSLFYRRTYTPSLPELSALHDALLGSADLIVLASDQQQRLEQVYLERAERSRVFFAEHAGEFGEQQEQMVAYGVYGQSCLELLRSSQANGGKLAIEIGPGEGAFLAELSPHYDKVIGVDNADTMLTRANEFINQQALSNVSFILGDSRNANLQQNAADCVVSNMVLHHVPSPAEIFKDAARLLKPGGIFCVTDLCRHDQSWARDACGDLWLGFEPDDLTEWAQASGLQDGPAAYLAQLNGFRVQVRQFIKPDHVQLHTKNRSV